jgi:hypothetical protein
MFKKLLIAQPKHFCMMYTCMWIKSVIMGNIAGRDVNIIVMVYFKDMPWYAMNPLYTLLNKSSNGFKLTGAEN